MAKARPHAVPDCADIHSPRLTTNETGLCLEKGKRQHNLPWPFREAFATGKQGHSPSAPSRPTVVHNHALLAYLGEGAFPANHWLTEKWELDHETEGAAVALHPRIETNQDIQVAQKKRLGNPIGPTSLDYHPPAPSKATIESNTTTRLSNRATPRRETIQAVKKKSPYHRGRLENLKTWWPHF
jgi:hypothetical protein